MKPSAKRFYSLVGSVMLLFGALFVFSNFIQPEYEEIQKIRGEREAKSNLLRDYKETAAALNELLQKYENVTQLQETLSLSLPIGEKVPDVFNQIQGVARLSGMRIDSISFQYLPLDYGDRATVLRPLGTLRMAVKVSGTYESLKRFLSSLETNIRILEVNTVAVEGGALSKNPVLNYNLTIDSRYQGER